uniref:Translation initiation factor IF-2 n=1 Tax=Cyanothece sp. (strain PCC 7425 / ATCC 29141) TaxID=395961 RepID=IF2_CYAP4|nr:RecName: Full=Translation initiation factor IF-2 [Cyanothece sp. PCC 7425]
MSNNKVRIYDLSRDLNLDNRDVLIICEQLNIPVKSHSSTISESEADRIRAAAEKYVPSPSTHSMPPTRPTSHSRPLPPQPGKPQPKVPQTKVPQILELRRHQTPAEPATGSAGSSVAPVSRSPVEPQAGLPKTASPQRPVRPAAPGSNSPSHSESTPVTPPAISKPAVSSSPARTEPLRPAVPPPKAAPSPAAMAGRAEPSQPGPQKPVLKRPKVESPQAEVESAPVATATPAPASPRAELTPPPRRELPQLKAPPRPRSETSEDGARRGEKLVARAPEPPGTETDAIEVLQNVSLPKLAGRGAKRPKTKAEEEDELQEELAAKTPKTATKLKRRPQLKLEDEDDVDFAAEVNVQAVVDVSQSLVRPPKPKAAKSAKPAAVATTRISAPKTGGRKLSRRDRRQQEETQERPTSVVLSGDLTVQELANRLALPTSEIIKTLFFKGIAATINQMLDLETASMVAREMGMEVETPEVESTARKVTEMLEAQDLENLQRRPPVVTIMGHVDHGKTTLLDAIRQTKVAQGEAGGITQHIGAYHVDVEHEDQVQQVVFLDTPGHEAFTAMRARGARVTDIAILVVAADDGVRPQTVEAISHAQAAEVPIVVAINKIDKPTAQPDRVKQELTEYNLVPEEWGGDTIMVPVSAINRENLDTLLEMILLVSEVEDLYANPDRSARGTVIEAHLDKARGPVATLLVQNGTLRVGDILLAGSALGKVRAMIDDRGQRVEAATPSFAVEVLGLGDVPAAGDEFEVFNDEREARAIANERANQQRLSRLQQALSSRRVSLTSLSDQAREGELKELNLILKADVQGSVEAILNALGQIPQNEVQLRVLYAAPGEVTETDVDLAAASNAVVIGFNTTLASGSRASADQTGVDIREYNIIYKLLDDIEGAMEGLLEPELVEEPLGQAQVRAVFPVGKGFVAGCYVQSGKLIRNCKIRVLRSGNLVHSGTLNSLKRIKEDAREVNAGYECGIRLDDFQGWAEGDQIEAYQMVTKRRTLNPNA